MIRLSASLVKDYLTCPARAFYRINHPEQAIQSKAMVLGTIVHAVIERRWNDKERALTLIQPLIAEHNLTSGEDKIYKCINNFFTMFSSSLGENDEIEKFFRYPYKEDVEIVGKIDRIHNKVIYDWKTGDSIPTQDDINHDIQMIMYWNAYKRLYNEEPKAIMYVSLATKKMYSFEYDPKVACVLEEEVLPMVIDGIRNKRFQHSGLFGYKACVNCSFLNTCYGDLELE